MTPEGILESLSDGCYAVDRAWRITYLNAAAEAAFRRPRRELLGAVLWETFPVLRGTAFERSYHDAMASSVEVACEDYFAPDGRWYSARAYPNPDGLTIFFREVTEQRRAAEALREMEERFARAVETTAGGVVILDAAGRITFANAAAEQILGLSRAAGADRLHDDPSWKITTDDGGPLPAEELPFNRVRATGAAVHDQRLAIERTDGARVILSVNASPLIDAAGRFVGVVASLHDVTAQHHAERARAQLEERLRHAQRFETIGKLAGGVAHDFNNILTAAMSYAELARDGLDPDAPARADLDEVIVALSRGSALTRQLLTIGRHREPRPRRLLLNAVVREIRPMLQRLLGEDVALDFALAPDLGYVNVDVGQIEQVIVNLAVNARDAMPGGGRITLATRNVGPEAPVRAGEVGRRSYVAIEITDTGCGMDEATQRRIFEPFFTTKGLGGGTGLGLATVGAIVERAGGAVRIESTPGAGTTVRVYLPSVEGAAGAARSEPPPPISTAREETVLVVEDEEMVRQSIARVLSERGFAVLEAGSGRDALDLLARGARVDLLLCDFVLPDLDGRQLLARLDSRHRPGHVVFMSGYNDDALRRYGGFPVDTKFIEKPFHPDALVVKLHEILAG